MSGLAKLTALGATSMLLGALALGACSGGSGSSPGTTSVTTSTSMVEIVVGSGTSDHPELEQAVRAYGVALFAGDAATVHAMQSARCKEVNGLDLLTQAVTSLAQEYGTQPMTSYTHRVDGDVGEATYEFRAPYLGQQDERWILEEGTWRNDDCPTPRPDDGTPSFTVPGS